MGKANMKNATITVDTSDKVQAELDKRRKFEKMTDAERMAAADAETEKVDERKNK